MSNEQLTDRDAKITGSDIQAFKEKDYIILLLSSIRRFLMKDFTNDIEEGETEVLWGIRHRNINRLVFLIALLEDFRLCSFHQKKLLKKLGYWREQRKINNDIYKNLILVVENRLVDASFAVYDLLMETVKNFNEPEDLYAYLTKLGLENWR